MKISKANQKRRRLYRLKGLAVILLGCVVLSFYIAVMAN